jgi:hypothetical protein
MPHTLPFLLNNLLVALEVASGVVVVELIGIALIRFHFMKTPLINPIVKVIIGGGWFLELGFGWANWMLRTSRPFMMAASAQR